MLIFYFILSACLGAYVGRLMALAVHFLPQILLEESNEESEIERNPRDIINWFLKNECYFCKKPILWWQNLPIIGYFLTKGKCSKCQEKLGTQLIFLEIGMAFLFAITMIASETMSQFIYIGLLSSLIICCFITDYEYGILPDQFTLSILWIALIGSIFNLFISPREAIIGAVAGYGIFWLMNEFYRFYRNKDGMFPGDFKFNAALGACLGIQQLLPILFIALILVMATTVIKYFYYEKPPLASFVRQEISYGCYAAVVSLATIYFKLYSGWLNIGIL